MPTYYRTRSVYILDVTVRDTAQRPHVPNLSCITAHQMLQQYDADKHIDCKEIDAAKHYEDFYRTGFKKGFEAGTGRVIEKVSAPAGPYSRMSGSLATLKNEGKLVWVKRGVYSIPSQAPDKELTKAEEEVDKLVTQLEEAKKKVDTLIRNNID